MTSTSVSGVMMLSVLLCVAHSVRAVDEIQIVDGLPMTMKQTSDLPTLEMITRAGYPAEAHVVTTDDGYILTLHRIPGSGPGVFIQHGLLGSSADWILTDKSSALPYILADLGYDVWLGNSRGNIYSKAHKTLSTKDPKYWDFSFHEMGVYDLPAVITYITDKIGGQIIYVGFSMGTTMSYVMGSERPDMSERIKLMFSLAPVGYMGHIKSPLRIIAPFSDNIERITKLFGYNEFLPRDTFVNMLATLGCNLVTVQREICKNILFAISGFDSQQFNKTLLPLITGHIPAGTSTKTLVHYGQEINSGRFCKFNYGKEKNLQKYNSTKPPAYDISKMDIPTMFIHASNDWLSSVVDVESLWKKVPNKIDLMRVSFPKFNHLDFLWAIDVRSFVYDEMIPIMHQYSYSE